MYFNYRCLILKMFEFSWSRSRSSEGPPENGWSRLIYLKLLKIEKPKNLLKEYKNKGTDPSTRQNFYFWKNGDKYSRSLPDKYI